MRWTHGILTVLCCAVLAVGVQGQARAEMKDPGSSGQGGRRGPGGSGQRPGSKPGASAGQRSMQRPMGRPPVNAEAMRKQAAQKRAQGTNGSARRRGMRASRDDGQTTRLATQSNSPETSSTDSLTTSAVESASTTGSTESLSVVTAQAPTTGTIVSPFGRASTVKSADSPTSTKPEAIARRDDRPPSRGPGMEPMSNPSNNADGPGAPRLKTMDATSPRTGSPGNGPLRDILETLDPEERRVVAEKIRGMQQQERRQLFEKVMQAPEEERKSRLLAAVGKSDSAGKAASSQPVGKASAGSRTKASGGTEPMMDEMMAQDSGGGKTEGNPAAAEAMIAALSRSRPEPYVIEGGDPGVQRVSRSGEGARGRMPVAGSPLPPISAVTPDGNTISLEAVVGKPTVIELGSITCPVFRQRIPAMNLLADRFKGAVNFIVVYTTEAHPTGEASPYSAEEWIPEKNRREGISKSQTRTLEERIANAREVAAEHGVRIPISIDTMDNTTWQALGGRPNSAVVLDAQGMVAVTQEWTDPEALSGELDKLTAK